MIHLKYGFTVVRQFSWGSPKNLRLNFLFHQQQKNRTKLAYIVNLKLKSKTKMQDVF